MDTLVTGFISRSERAIFWCSSSPQIPKLGNSNLDRFSFFPGTLSKSNSCWEILNSCPGTYSPSPLLLLAKVNTGVVDPGPLDSVIGPSSVKVFFLHADHRATTGVIRILWGFAVTTAGEDFLHEVTHAGRECLCIGAINGWHLTACIFSAVRTTRVLNLNAPCGKMADCSIFQSWRDTEWSGCLIDSIESWFMLCVIHWEVSLGTSS